MRRIAVIGSRGYTKLDLVRQFVWEQERNTVIISGGARGVDETAVSEANRLRMPYEVYLPDWNRDGRSAGAKRNRIIVEKADEIVAFWDGESAGTAITIEMAKLAKKPLRVIR